MTSWLLLNRKNEWKNREKTEKGWGRKWRKGKAQLGFNTATRCMIFEALKRTSRERERGQGCRSAQGPHSSQRRGWYHLRGASPTWGSGLPQWLSAKESACSAGHSGLIKSPGGHGNPLQYPCLENPQGQRSLSGCRPWGHKELRLKQFSTHAQGLEGLLPALSHLPNYHLSQSRYSFWNSHSFL